MNNWKDIWNNQARVSDYFLELLFKLDGFDSVTGSFTVEDWKYYTNDLLSLLNIAENDSVFEVGCGSGAFIYGLSRSQRKLGGIDYSKFLIDFANKFFNESYFILDEAININTDDKFDFVISHSVFNYFDSIDYARQVLKKMVMKSNKKVAIYDINDKSKEEIYDLVRSGNDKKGEYKVKYKTVSHIFYEKDWFIELSNELNCHVEIFDQRFFNYPNSSLRFNVIFSKNIEK